jgi:hypothetical protein
LYENPQRTTMMEPRRAVRLATFCSQAAVGGAVIGVALLLGLGCGSSNIARAASPANAQSPLAMNLLNVNYYTEEQPFLDLFKTTGISQSTPTGWWTGSVTAWDTGEEAYLQLDAGGYPTTLTARSGDSHTPQLFDHVSVLLARNLEKSDAGTGPAYRAGKYVVTYSGRGTLAYSGDAALMSSSPGRDVINVATPSAAGIVLQITATDPKHTGNYIRNIQVVKAEEQDLLAAGKVFAPHFLTLMQNFRALRFMQWLNMNSAGGDLANWANRPLPTDAGWGGPNGVPIEVAVELCNALASDCWLNVPHQATDEYIMHMASLVHTSLGATQRAYVELSNEVWNQSFPQYAYAAAKGRALWPGGGPAANYNGNWYGMRTAQTCDLWKAAWGADASRLTCVMGAQAGNFNTAETSLNCPLWSGAGHAPCSGHGIGAVAISPYLFVTPQASWNLAADGGLSQLFAAITESLRDVSAGEAQYKAALARYNLPYLAYEGGQSLVGAATPAMQKLFVAANRDPRMQTVYATLLNNWKTNGGQLFAIYASIYAPSAYGEWGALESFMDTVTPLANAPPKWRALQSFIASTPCWWTGCSGALGSASTAAHTGR